MDFLKGELHCHTEFSPCSNLSLERLLEVCRLKNFSFVAITDHNTIEGALEFQSMAPFKVIVGEEMSTTSGHVIGYFLRERIPGGLSMEETVDLIKLQGGLVCIPHPFDSLIPARRKMNPEKILALKDKIDLIEVFNSRNIFQLSNKKAKDFADKNGFIATVGSDAHFPGEVGRCYVEMHDFSSPTEFLENLRGARLFMGKGFPGYHFISKWLKITSKK